jgi:pseudaminic acid biosynthesis-associated methylase
MNTQLENWSSDFGREYTNRNVIDWHVRLPAFRTMLSGLNVSRVLEVGCNRGHNLLALSELFGEDREVIGIEPNPYAVELARASSSKVAILRGNIFDLPFKAGSFDLVFTVGVLIHIPLESLQAAMLELARVSSRYLLAAEYFAEKETAISYRGSSDLLWKRDFLRHFQECLPGITVLRSGYWGAEDGFDRDHWWLLEKPAQS